MTDPTTSTGSPADSRPGSPPDSPADAVIAQAEADPAIMRLLQGKRVVKRIHVPNRIVNFVVAG